ncbi:hypothetical protein llap_15051 [Limosa lapponica baueri]|uniref:Uncharacterized protein n=1 Tax=Limosa lapponica baueri TaxID=1758121 RepID=A0A2I0TLH3_LIMLA|nr:hypothetical protein llap_15051 [Limosa lapponica baueri]
MHLEEEEATGVDEEAEELQGTSCDEVHVFPVLRTPELEAVLQKSFISKKEESCNEGKESVVMETRFHEDVNLLRFNKAKCKVLHLDQYRLRDEGTQSSPAEKDLEVLVDEQGSEQPDLVEDVPAHGRGFGLDGL